MCARIRFHPLLPTMPAIVARPKQRSNFIPTFSSLRRRWDILASASMSEGGELRLEEHVPKTKEKELNRKELDLERERERERNGEGGVEIELSSKVGVGTDRWKGRSGREIFRRSHLLAKQVVAVESALSLGFVSQLWVDPSTWNVVVVEVRPSLLSADSDRFLLKDVRKVGDVLLVENEGELESELKMAGLATLVGYEVVTPGSRSIGKVRGYSFNVNSGLVELLEIDSFGISIVPSSLVSTYALNTEDVLEVASDTVFVQEGAAGRLQRLTRGWWGSRNVAASGDEDDEDTEKPVQSARSRRGRRGLRRKKYPSTARKNDDDWDLPMDFL